MISELDNARVLRISEKGYYGQIPILESDEVIEICYLAICKYDNSNTVYLFLCDDNLSVENDWDFDSVEEAIAYAQKRSQNQIVWVYPNG